MSVELEYRIWGKGKTEVRGKGAGTPCRPLNGMIKNADIIFNSKIL